MAYRLPSLADIVSRVRSALTAEIPGADAMIWPNNLYVVGKVIGGQLFEAHLRLEWLYRQLFVSTADGAHLDRHAYEVGLARKPAAYAGGSVRVSGTPGETVPAGRRFIRADGRAYVSTEAIGIPASGSVILPVLADEAGWQSNTPAATVLERETDYEELTSEATVSSDGLTGGASAEADADLRERILYRKRNPPMGGALADYKAWAEAVVGVRRAFAAAYSNGGKMVQVYILADGNGATAIPNDVLVSQVAAAIEEERPVTAYVTVTKPTAVAIPITIESLAPDSRAVRDEIERELIDLFYERATVILPGGETTFPRSWIEAAIDAAAGEDRHHLVSPADDVALTAGQYPVLGTITFS